METGGASNDDHVHGTVAKKRVKVPVRPPAEFLAEAGYLFPVRAPGSGDFRASDCGNSAGVCPADVSAANQTNVHRHALIPFSRLL
jgi:hypothetical protein